ncbi:Uncharacterised protein [BD1-7 clade bacterium]|uniref:Fe(2+)/Mn(2+) transporter pcl1 n=1 Tax=BD1-7 clade bacterium TaxID=2029982 RepID=A0A5S9QHJ2_9GAMM|nr:Uncharacterised protein [BD1-7 clade bacterium]
MHDKTAAPENQHLSHRTAWLRAAVLGANDGLISTASLVVGVISAGGDAVLAGIAGVVGGAMSMAAGEYVSVSSQADTEKADIELERQHLANNPEYEVEELAQIYRERGLTQELSHQVAEQLMAHDALAAHTRDELGITDQLQARPTLAALSSFFAFLFGAVWPLLAAWLNVTFLFPHPLITIAVGTAIMLILLGGLAAKMGGASVTHGAIRVCLWGLLAMLATALTGRLFALVVG